MSNNHSVIVELKSLCAGGRNNYLEGLGCSKDIVKYNSTNFHVIQTTRIENYYDNFSVLCMDNLCF